MDSQARRERGREQERERDKIKEEKREDGKKESASPKSKLSLSDGCYGDRRRDCYGDRRRERKQHLLKTTLESTTKNDALSSLLFFHGLIIFLKLNGLEKNISYYFPNFCLEKNIY